MRGRNKYFKKADLDRALSDEDVKALGKATVPEVAIATDLGHAAASYICYGSELQTKFNEAGHKFTSQRIKMAWQRAKLTDSQRACFKEILDFTDS